MKPFRSSISVYVLTPMIALTLLSGLLIVMILLQERAAQNRMIEEKHAELVKHSMTLHEEYRDELKSVASLISNHPLVKNGLLIGNQYEVLNSIAIFLGHSGIEIINVYDVDGVAFARAQAPSRFGDKDVYSDLIHVLTRNHVYGDDRNIIGLLSYAGNYYLVAAKLIDSISGPAGTVVVATELSENYLSRLLPEWHAGLNLYRDEERLVGSSDSESGLYLGSLLVHAERDIFSDAEYEIRLALTDEVFPEFGKLPFGIILIIGITAFLSVIITFLILFNKVITPAKHLISIAEKQVSGNLSERVEINSNDELGKLGNILNVLTRNLQRTLDEKESIIKKLNLEYGKVEKNRSQLNEIIQSIPNPIAITSVDSGKIILANRAFGEYFGVGIDRYDAVDIGEFFELPSQHLYTETATSSGSLVKIRNANQLYALHYSKAIEFEDQSVTFNAFVDISSRVQFEDKITRLNEDLERRVEERTRDLLLAKHKAESANESKSRFLAAASHDLRQPVNAMSLFIANLLENPDSSRLEHDLQNIASCIISLRGMFDQILDISRLEAGVVEPNICSFAINDLFHQIRHEYGKMASEKGLDFRCINSSIYVRSDPILLHRIIANLISNAIKNTRKGKILLGCKRDIGSQNVRIIVMDAGPGIPESDMRNIFKEYYRGHTRYSRKNDSNAGMGLGLSIVEHTAKLLQHELNVSSVVGKFSKFSISVPLSDHHQNDSDSIVNYNHSDNFDGLSVLLVEDDKLSLEALSTTLQNWGCNVSRANSYMQACDVLVRGEFIADLIVTDYLLDEQTGVDVIEMAESIYRNSIPAIILSGVLDRRLEAEIKSKGCMLMYKPVCPAELKQNITSIITIHS
jgi:signal transduction histidine kinase/CheY-like chemotaxis protein